MDFLKRLVFVIVEFLLKATHKISTPLAKKLLSGQQVEEIMKTVKAGDILAVKIGGYLTSSLLGGISHVAFVMNKDQVSDSTGVGISVRPLLAVLVGYTRAAILRPKFTNEEFELLMEANEKGLLEDGGDSIEYNWYLADLDEKQELPESMTCSQWIKYLVNYARPGFMESRKRFGFMGITPGDFYAAKSKFDLIGEWNGKDYNKDAVKE